MDLNERQKVCQWIQEQANQLLLPRPRCIAIFGSFASGALRETSDIDILLIGDSIPRSPYERSQWFLPFNQAWRRQRPHPQAPQSCSPLMTSEAGWLGSLGLRLSLSENCWILMDDGFLSDSLREAREWIHQGLWHKRLLSKGGWMWIPRDEVA